MKRTLLLLAVFISLCDQLSFAQARKTVSGSVRTANGDAIPGVTITEKGTSNGAISQTDGSYRLSVAPNATLVLITSASSARRSKPATPPPTTS
ncbi:carboxypeptidase-like regulatory domain-containing protein [Chitinophaga sp. GCM10012297]|uniref:carboxypeptidase-like regulatory domain-containing protein n=1 Tax=Chitinophaga TaxID=79328 RepID=UPI001F2825B2|nr:carboxypeptidase-like regulatory domain-containing protein [Chitinophaga chungangae]